MQDPKGFFYYPAASIRDAKIPMLHWGQATMFKALAIFSLKASPGSEFWRTASKVSFP